MTEQQISAIADRIAETMFSPLLTTAGTDASTLRLCLMRHSVISGEMPKVFLTLDRKGFSEIVTNVLARAIPEVSTAG